MIARLFLILIVVLPNLVFAGVADIFQGKTEIPSPEKLRDPFKPPKMKIEVADDAKPKTKKSNGVYSNIKTIGNVKLNDVRVSGVLVGQERRAILNINNSLEQYIIREGDTLGENQAKVRAIVPGGLILVEKVTNIYGETEYLETVIPISK